MSTRIMHPRTAKSRATVCAIAAEDKLGNDVVVLDMKSLDSAPSDYFVIVTCGSEAHVRAVADSVLRKCKSAGMGTGRTEGMESLNWVVIDYFDVVVHIMLEEIRNFYKIERLWGDAVTCVIGDKGVLVKFKPIPMVAS